MVHVSWYDAVAYCNWLSDQEGLTHPMLQWNANGANLKLEQQWLPFTNGGRVGVCLSGWFHKLVLLG